MADHGTSPNRFFVIPDSRPVVTDDPHQEVRRSSASGSCRRVFSSARPSGREMFRPPGRRIRPERSDQCSLPGRVGRIHCRDCAGDTASAAAPLRLRSLYHRSPVCPPSRSAPPSVSHRRMARSSGEGGPPGCLQPAVPSRQRTRARSSRRVASASSALLSELSARCRLRSNVLESYRTARAFMPEYTPETPSRLSSGSADEPD